MKHRTQTLVLMAALLFAAAGGAYAIPSLGGPTGVVSLPNALIAPTEDLQTAITYHPFETMGMYAPNDATAWTLQALRGVSDSAELWGAYSRVHNGADTNVWQIGGKMQVVGLWESDAQVAIGGSVGRWVDAFGLPFIGAPTDLDVVKAYIVATRDLTPASTSWDYSGGGNQVMGSAGMVLLRANADVGGSESLMRPFVCIEITQGAQMFAAEWRWKDSDVDGDHVFSVVFRRPIAENMEIEIGTTNASPVGLGLDNQDFFLRLGYDVPMGIRYY